MTVESYLARRIFLGSRICLSYRFIRWCILPWIHEVLWLHDWDTSWKITRAYLSSRICVDAPVLSFNKRLWRRSYRYIEETNPHLHWRTDFLDCHDGNYRNLRSREWRTKTREQRCSSSNIWSGHIVLSIGLVWTIVKIFQYESTK